MLLFMDGAIAMGCCVAALYFARFWRHTRDPFFAMFSLSFLLLAGGRVMAAVNRLPESSEASPELYLMRLAAFIIMIVAIVHKNRASSSPSFMATTQSGR